MEMRIQLPSSHLLTVPVHPSERVTGPPELHHSDGRFLRLMPIARVRNVQQLRASAIDLATKTAVS